MTIFALLLPLPQEALAARVVQAYPDNFLKLNDLHWLISSRETAIEVTKKLGIVDPEMSGPALGTGIIFATSSYYGRAPTATWDWIKAKLEAGGANG